MYSELDEEWVRNKLLPIITNQGKPYKVHLLTTHQKGFDKNNKNELDNLSLSKRVILVMSKNFIRQEWKSDTFQVALKSLCAYDPDCVIIPISIDDESADALDENVRTLEEYEEEDSCLTCNKQIKYSTKLADIEFLKDHEEDFARNLKFLLPIMKKTGKSSTITEALHLKRDTLSPFSLGIDDNFSLIKKETSVAVKNEQRDDLPLISSARKKNTVPNEDLVIPFNEPTPRDKRLKDNLLNNYFNRQQIETNINKAHGSLTTPRENEAPKLRDKSTERSRRETEQPRSARFETLKPNKHTNTEIDLNRRTNFIKNDNLESRLFTTDSFLLTLPNATEITKDNQNVFFPASSTSLIPIVSASKYKQESEVTPRDESNKHQNKKHKKHKSKGKRKQKSQTEDNRESFNIWPVNDDENAAYATINADITTKDRRQHRDRSSDQ